MPTSDATSRGLRPIRSDSRPQIGAKTSWAIENDATSSPTVLGLAPNRSAYLGRIGTTIPKPTRSRATQAHMALNPGGIDGVGQGQHLCPSSLGVVYRAQEAGTYITNPHSAER